VFVVQGVRLYDAAQNQLKDQYSHKVGGSSRFVCHLFTVFLILLFSLKAAVLDVTSAGRSHAFSAGMDRRVVMYVPTANICSHFWL
jgi:hypothetical protein